MKSALYNSGSSQAKDLNHAVAYHIVKDAMPLSTVDKPGFQFMVLKLNPRYQLSSHKHFSENETPRMYAEVRDNVVTPLVKQAAFYSATTNMWTSGSNDTYVTFTIHLSAMGGSCAAFAWRHCQCLQTTLVKI